MAWAKNGTPNTLGSSGDDIDIIDLTAYKFNVFFEHTFETDTQAISNYTLDDNGNTDYAVRRSINGGVDSIVTCQSNVQVDLSSLGDNFTIQYAVNIDSEEKLFIAFNIAQVVAGATTAPQRKEQVWKADTTTNTGQFTRIDLNNSGVGSFDTNSNLSALGTD